MKLMTEDARLTGSGAWVVSEMDGGAERGHPICAQCLLAGQTTRTPARLPAGGPARIGVMGHSLGGSAALCIGRQRPDVQAVLALESPFMCDIEGVRMGNLFYGRRISRSGAERLFRQHLGAAGRAAAVR